MDKKEVGMNQDAAQAERRARTQAPRELFAWIDAQPAVPHLPLDAMGRDEIYGGRHESK